MYSLHRYTAAAATAGAAATTTTTKTTAAFSLSNFRSFSSIVCSSSSSPSPLHHQQQGGLFHRINQQKHYHRQHHPKTLFKIPLFMKSSSSSLFSTKSPKSGDEILKSLFESKNKSFHGKNVPLAIESLANADAVAFDVDSTVITEEGIDVLAASLGKGEEVAAWTLKAMEGNTKFEDALAARLNIIRPSKKDIEICLKQTPLHLSPGIDRLIHILQNRGTDVFLVSGGFRLMIEPMALTQLSIPSTHVYANTLLFDDDSQKYIGFDSSEPTSKDMGKPKALQQIKDQFGYDIMVMVGDGATDMQARPPANAFIGYGGVSIRDAVQKGADWFVTDFEDMITVVSNT